MIRMNTNSGVFHHGKHRQHLVITHFDNSWNFLIIVLMFSKIVNFFIVTKLKASKNNIFITGFGIFMTVGCLVI